MNKIIKRLDPIYYQERLVSFQDDWANSYPDYVNHGQYNQRQFWKGKMLAKQDCLIDCLQDSINQS